MARIKKPSKTNSIVKQIEKKAKKSKNVEDLILLPSPLTLMNCACAESPFGAFYAGEMLNLIGDSHSGKSILALSMFAEIDRLSQFDDYEFIYDDAEHANAFDMNKMFGEKTANRIKAPEYDEDDNEIHSDTIEDFHCNIMDKLEEGIPFIYILDSFDALDAEGDIAKREEMRTARKKGTKAKGSYAMAKPKKASELFRDICGELKNTKSFLIVISQTRDNIDPMSFEKKNRAGGKALKFYCSHEIWLAVGKSIKRKGRTIGNDVIARIKKNKLTGKIRDIKFSTYPTYGIDDISSCIDFMESEDFWKKKKNTIIAEHLNLEGTKQALIKQIEENNMERKLSKIVHRKWMEIEEDLKLIRKPKY